jgi:ATP-dependent RNA helicase DDX46/PRP5
VAQAAAAAQAPAQAAAAAAAAAAEAAHTPGALVAKGGLTPAQIAQAAAQSVFAKMKQPQKQAAGAQNTKAIALAQSYALAHGASAGAAKAAALAAALNAQHAKTSRGPTQSGSHFETELEINDFPQFARYKVTHKDTLVQIMEHTGAAVTAKGQYAAPGRPLAPGDRKLYLLIEGPTERVVKEGKNYVKNIIETAIAKQALPGAAGQPQGRYRV